MLDIRLIRKEPKECESRLQKKDPAISLERLLDLDKTVRQLKADSEALLAKRKVLSGQIHKAKVANENADALIQEVNTIADQLVAFETTLQEQEALLEDLMARLPNYPDEDVPVSPDKTGNQVIKGHGEVPTFPFPPKHHMQLNEALQILDFKLPAKTTGSGWPAYCNEGVLLEWALLTYLLNKQQAHGFQLWLPPLLVKRDILFGSGQIPKFDGQYYRVED